MATVNELTVILERGARRLATEAVRAQEEGAQPEGLRGEADAFVLLAYELREEGDPIALLDSLHDMARIALWTARRDEQQAAEFDSQGDSAASRFHARSARYTRGLLRGYEQVRLLLATCCPDAGPGAGLRRLAGPPARPAK